MLGHPLFVILRGGGYMSKEEGRLFLKMGGKRRKQGHI